ncbi:putative S-acyltransferase TIP1-like [Capsicum annuum]|uniref:Uncharacterized protein n=1 Tax=Capsicum annuum TaxID=4072 RepID=A0A2G2YQR2_CAPAN|nr:putative S-acyltransferase TIP1-like [Capsicum annuum]KAF3625843.1 putative S-acyltransferase TIP1-like [Capsicum annuum]PHT72073.1 hypothetical protein T459_22858 [Capsicum annuum]
MQALFSLGKLVQLDFERCPRIHGGFVHLQGLSKLESLSIRCCQCIMDSDMEPLPGIASLKELQVVCIYITDYGVSYLGGLNKLVVLNMEGSHVTTSCLDTISELPSQQSLNLNRYFLRDDGCEKFSALSDLNVLNLGFNHITDECLGHLKGLTKLEGLNLDSCKITDDEFAHLSGIEHQPAKHNVALFKNNWCIFILIDVKSRVLDSNIFLICLSYWNLVESLEFCLHL